MGHSNKQYHVSSSTRLNDIIEEVDDYMKSGWTPIGGIQVVAKSPDNVNKLYYQAMTVDWDKVNE